MARYVITGTGTDVGKTVFAAGLCGLIGATYWKPVQSGLVGNLPNADGTGRAQPVHSAYTARTQAAQSATDAADIVRLAGAQVVPEGYRLTQPLSPHRAAELDGVSIDPAALTPPDFDPLVIEGAGGVLVPVTRQILFADLFAEWQIPVILVATTGLGTISHSLTALEALRSRNVPVHGVVFVGEDNPDNMASIGQIGAVPVLGRLPLLDPLNRETLSDAMAANFRSDDF
ncbi:dethiobiotin synthase [Paracoccus tegillarcae]|uniref:ATP-dependent dethiobiotin synthetase BioD n=1 Tax=Paracoccus tegillarcae TaxID=1529068 RepID=A0A2K9EFN4_9RHOB|nr:dethiobiotin synthase [Paracoccus tegillarcae]AUH33768.1 dethiobiotin synthase [Paracoccus tegillarcae]